MGVNEDILRRAAKWAKRELARRKKEAEFPIFDVKWKSTPEPSFRNIKWKCADGRVIRLKDMTDVHLANASAFLLRKAVEFDTWDYRLFNSDKLKREAQSCRDRSANMIKEQNYRLEHNISIKNEDHCPPYRRESLWPEDYHGNGFHMQDDY
jgi:hypothetical protein